MDSEEAPSPSIELRAGFLHHARPARLLVSQPAAEAFRRARAYLRALLCEALLHVRRAQHPGQLRVQLRYGLARRSGGPDDALERPRLEAGQSLLGYGCGIRRC